MISVAPKFAGIRMRVPTGRTALLSLIRQSAGGLQIPVNV